MKFSVKEVEFFERPVKLRMPFRFGVVTLTEAPQAFVRSRIVLENGREAEGAAAELLAPMSTCVLRNAGQPQDWKMRPATPGVRQSARR
jgi:hypothetical protein